MKKSKQSVDASAFRQGFDARMNNRTVVSCPFPDGNTREEWLAGFRAASNNHTMTVTREGPTKVLEESFLPEPTFTPDEQESLKAIADAGGVSWPKK